MKKILLLALMFCLAIQTSKAQMYDIYIPDHVILTNNQWHAEGYSVIQANDNLYLIITPSGYEYYTLMPFRALAFSQLTGDLILSYKPYFYDNTLGWFVEGRRYSYFVYPSENYVILNYYPVYYDYHYNFYHVRYLNMRNFYWHRHFVPHPLHPYRPHYNPGMGRPPMHTRPPMHKNPPRHANPPSAQPGQHRPPQRSNGSGTQTRPPQRSSGSATQSRPPQRSSGSSTQTRPPQRSSGSATQSRPPQRSSGSSTHTRPPQRSSGSATQSRPPQRSNGSGTQTRPPQRSSGNTHSSGRSGGSSSRRR